MPCRCDYEEPSFINVKVIKDAQQIKLCQAQSLAYKLSLILKKNNITLPNETELRISANNAQLLSHKKKEHKEDIEDLQRSIELVDNKIKEIKKLGGDPKKAIVTSLLELRGKKAKALNITDDELLGDENY